MPSLTGNVELLGGGGKPHTDSSSTVGNPAGAEEGPAPG